MPALRPGPRWLVWSGPLLVGLGLRLWGIGFGLPDLFHPDEPAYVLQALAVGGRLPDGLTFANPPLFKYLLLAEYAGDYGLQRVLGITSSPQDFIAQFRADPSQLYLLARITSAVLGAATALAAGLVGAAVAGRRAGLIAAWLTAVAYLLVRDAHFGVDDALVTLLVTVGLVACVRIARGGTRRDYVAGGALAGLAFVAKYDGIALLAPLVLAHWLRNGPRPRRGSDLGVSVAACVVAAVVAFPSLLSEPGRVLQDVYVHLYLGATGGYDGLDPAGGYVYYARSLVIGLGWPLIVAVGAGLLLAVRHPPLLVVVALPVSMIAVLGAQQMYFARFLLPTLPALVVTAAVALDSLVAITPALGLSVALVAALPTLVDAVRFDVLLTRVDTRREAADWVATQLPSDTMLAVDAPPLGPRLATANQRLRVANAAALFDSSAAEYRAQGVEYVIASSFTSEVRSIDPARDARRVAFYAGLERDAELVAQFRPYSDAGTPPFVYDQIYAPFNSLDAFDRPGPKISVYRLNVRPDTPP